jgi:hypothetical protein
MCVKSYMGCFTIYNNITYMASYLRTYWKYIIGKYGAKPPMRFSRANWWLGRNHLIPVKRSATVYYQGAQNICKVYLNIHLLKNSYCFAISGLILEVLTVLDSVNFLLSNATKNMAISFEIGDCLFISLYLQTIYHYTKACPTAMRKTDWWTFYEKDSIISGCTNSLSFALWQKF